MAFLKDRAFDSAARNNDWQHVNSHKLIRMKYISPIGKAEERSEWGRGRSVKERKERIWWLPFLSYEIHLCLSQLTGR